MSQRSGERARRAALGLGHARNGGQIAQALQTIRASVLDKRRPPPPPRSELLNTRKDTGHLLWALKSEIQRITAKRDQNAERLKRGERDRIEVSDHAVVRFLERAMKINIAAVRDQIARLIPSDRLEEDRTIYVRGGVQFYLHKNRLITVLDEYMDPIIEEAFAIDDAAIGEAPERIDGKAEAASIAARTLSRRAHEKGRTRIAEMTARLRAELDAQMGT